MTHYFKLSNWLMTIFITGSIYLLLANIDVEESYNVDHHYFNMVLDSLNLEKDDKVVIALGNSLLRNGSEKTIIKTDTGSKIYFIPFYISAGSIEHFHPIFEKLSKAKINLVLIQSDLLIFNNYNYSKFEFSNNTIKRNLKNLIDLNHKIKSITEYELKSKNKFDLYKRDISIEGKVALLSNKMKLPKKFSNTFNKFINLFRSQKSKIAIIDIPYSKNVNSIIKLPELKKSYYDYWYENYSIDNIKFPYDLDLSYYADYTHFNEKGMNFYFDWLKETIKQKITNE